MNGTQSPSVSFTKAQKAVLNNAQSIIAGYCKDESSPVDIWIGAKEITNPNTGEIIGTRQTANLDLYVSEEDFTVVKEAMDFLSNSGTYLEGNFYGKELIAIKARTKEVKTSAGTVKKYIVQFSKQQTSRVTELAQAKERLNVFDEDFQTMKAESNAGTAKSGARF